MPASDLVRDTAAQIEGVIRAEALRPGDLLPTERELSRRFDVSRSVVREAIRQLQSLGRIASLQGSGTRVASPSGKQVAAGYEYLLHHEAARWEHLAQARLPLETAIAELAAEHRTEEHLAQLAETQQILGDAERTLDEQAAADVRFHAILADSTGNPIFGLLLAPLAELLIQSRMKTLSQFGADLAAEHHGRILDAVARRRPKVAAAEMEMHLRTNAEHLARFDGAKQDHQR